MLRAMDGITLKAIDQAGSFMEGIERRTLREYLMQDLVSFERSDDLGERANEFAANRERVFGDINTKFQASVEAITGENREKLCAGEHKLTGHSNFADYRI